MDGWREGGAGLKPGGSRSDFSRITYNEFLFTMNMNMKKWGGSAIINFEKGAVQLSKGSQEEHSPVVRVGVARAVAGERNHAMVRQSLARDVTMHPVLEAGHELLPHTMRAHHLTAHVCDLLVL